MFNELQQAALSQQQPPGQPSPGQGASAGAGGQGAGPPGISEQELPVYEGTLGNARKFLHSEEGTEQVLSQLQQSEDFADGIGMVTGNMLRAIVDSAGQAGAQLPANVLNAVGKRIVEDIGEIAHASGLWDPVDQNEVDRALSEGLIQAVRHYGLATGADKAGQPPQQSGAGLPPGQGVAPQQAPQGAIPPGQGVI